VCLCFFFVQSALLFVVSTLPTVGYEIYKQAGRVPAFAATVGLCTLNQVDP
jgi:hypothetical protein